jgi:hypothetical protein
MKMIAPSGTYGSIRFGDGTTGTIAADRTVTVPQGSVLTLFAAGFLPDPRGFVIAGDFLADLSNPLASGLVPTLCL